MPKITIIGDVHSKIDQYKEIISKKDKSICVGDFGFQKEHDWHLENVDSSSHTINFGNHDYFPYIYQKHSMGRYSVYHNLFTISGACSVDRRKRFEGITWFKDEELNFQQSNDCIKEYSIYKPRIVVSHECPQFVRTVFGIYDKTHTASLLEELFNIHKPELWIFGHHHRSYTSVISGCRFVCLNELETMDIEI